MQTTIAPDAIHQTLGELVVSMPAAKQIFSKYDLDYCCGGKRSLEEACLQKGLQPLEILSEINNTSSGTGNFPLRVQGWSTGFLIDFIVENYHHYIRQSAPEILQLVEKVCLAHAEGHPYLLKVREAFTELSEELMSHMQKEELILFPALRDREEEGTESFNPIVSMIHHPIAAMEDEHEMAGNYLKTIRTLTNNYAPPLDACPTFILTYQKLSEFDVELINHIHLENNVLFKRV